MRTPWLRTLAVALTLTLVVTGLAVLPAPPAGAGSAAPQTTTAPPSAGKPGLVDRMKGLLGIGKPADDSRSLALPRREAAPVDKRLPPAKRVRELSARRRANSKLFKLADGRVQAELSSAPVHYRDRQGNWQDIDTRVAASASRPGYAYGNQTNAFGSFFGTSSQRLVRVQLGARAVGLGLAEAGRPLSPRVKGDQVTYRDAAAGGADLTYQVTPGALKEQLVLDRPPADPTWTFTLDLEGLVARPRQDGSIALHDNSGKGQPLLVMPRPFMTDSAADPSSPYGKAWSDKVTQTVTQQGSRLRLTVRADRAWLASPQRKYPVVIDPTIKLQPPVSSAQDVMVSSEAPSSNLDGNWRLGVGTTPGGVYRSLLRFPLDQVPPGTQVQAAELMTYFDQAHTTNDQAVTISAHRATSAWDEATATWANASSNVGEQGRTSPWVDDGELEKTAAEGEWVLASDPNAQVGDYRYNQNATTGESYTWVPSVVVDGDYSVQVHHVAGADRATAAPYTVTHANRTTSYTVNQSAGTGGVWTTLGSHRFTPGTSGRIRLGDVADPSKKVVADAVRLVMPGTQVKAAKQASRWHSFQVTSIVQKWLDGTEPNHGFVLKATDEATLGRGGPLYEAAEYAYTGGELAANFPKLVVTYGLPGVQLKPVTTVHATGAELEWTPYVDPSPKEGDDIVEYRVHRSNYQDFTPSPANRLATVPANQTAFVDTAATPTPADSADPMGKAYYYMVAVKTKGGQVIYGTQERVRLPKAGRVVKILQGDAADTTLSSGEQNTGHDLVDGQPYLMVGNNAPSIGTARALLKFPIAAGAVPAGARILNAEVNLWSAGTVGSGATYRLHKLTRGFDETATWTKANAATTWSNPGGDYVAQHLDAFANQTGEPRWRAFTGSSLVQTAQDWVADPSTNHGFLVRLKDEAAAGPQERSVFLSSEAEEPGLRPRMVLTYLVKSTEHTYYAPATPTRMIPGDSYTVDVTVTNTTTSTWLAANWVLSYRWTLPDGTPVNTGNPLQTALPKDLVPGDLATVKAQLKTPIQSDAGNKRTEYVLQWDLFNKTTNQWLSATESIQPLAQRVAVEDPSSNQLGLEKFYAYAGKPTGAGSTAMNNLSAGNTVWSYNPFSNPSRGLATFVRLSYNSLDTSASSMGFGWSLSAASVMRQGTPLDFHPNPNPTTVTLSDGDGTSHAWTWDAAAGQWKNPKGVHLYLQRLVACDPQTETDRAWVMTRPDRTQFFFDCEGYLSSTEDNNGNRLEFTYDVRRSNNKPTKFLRQITDPAGRQTLTIDHYAKGDSYTYIDDATWQKRSGTNLTNPHIIDNVKQLTDVSGRKLTFTYSDKGLLGELVDGAGTAKPKVFGFTYDATQGNKNVKLIKVTDPRLHDTRLAYYDPPGDDPKFHWWTKTITDRRGHDTGFAYTDPDGPAGSQIQTVVTDAESNATTYLMDGYGRPTRTTNAKTEPTNLEWDADNNVTRLQEANGAAWTWTYDAKTGYPLTITDAQANADGTAPTTLTYQRTLNGFVAELTEKRSPEGRRWAFGYDTLGNLTSVTDPKGTATSTPDDYKTTYEYDASGQLSKATDANEHATLFKGHDANGYPTTITNARTKDTEFTYDVRGNVLTVKDARQKTTTQTYDVFGRPLERRVPKNQDAGEFIVTPAPEYDANDNVTKATAPNGAVTTAIYDPADQPTSMTLPKDQSGDPARTVGYTYDKVGNLKTQTEPKGILSTGDPDDFVTSYGYDQIYQLTSVTNASNERLSYAYDNVGNLTTVVDPRKNATTDPADFTAKYAYDRAHRLLTVTDAAGHQTATDYDLDGLAVSTTDQEGNTTLTDRDERGMPREVKVPHDNPGGTIGYRTTRYEYDEVGNQTRVITPRGVATTTDPDDFAYGTVYDELNRVKEQLLPFDRDDSQVTTPDKVVYDYDDVGNLTQVSAPPSAGQAVRNVTKYGHFDNGWVRSSTDPWDITSTYNYNDLGQQTSRTITSAGSSPSCTSRDQCRTMTWTYFPDGKLSGRSDTGVPVGQQVVLVDNSDTPNVAVTGTWPTATSGNGFQGHDYRTHAAGSGAATFTWKLHVPQSGTYEVFAKYPAGGTATNAPYKVEHAGGSTTKAVNQTQQAGTWVSLGSFSFSEGDGGAGRQVTLSDNANGTVVADAVKLVRDHSTDPDNEGKDLSYQYDPNGNLVSATDASSDARVDAYTIAYDGLNRVQTVRERNGGITGTVRNTTSFTYDPNGNPATRTHDDEFAEYAYDTRDLVERATTGESATDPDPKVTRFTYTPRGQQLRQTKANNNTVDHTYFLDGLLKTQVEKKANGTLVSSHTIAYDPNGHRSSDAAKKQNADNHAAYLDHVYAYTYDPRDRIRQVTKSAAGGGVLETESYTHDANNNVIAQTVDNVPTSFVYDRNRLLSATSGTTTAAYNYDPFGRLDKVTAGTTVLERYAYDGFDRVKEHRRANGQGGTDTTRYAYDPLDRTTSRTEKAGAAGEKRTDFNYLGLSGEVLSEEIAGQVQKSYQYGPWGQRLSQVKFTPGGGTEDSFFGYNPHSDVETLTNEAGDTRATYGYTAYGKSDSESFTGIDKPDPQNPTAEPYNVYRFNAKRFDPASGDYDMGFRDYDPGLNRFLTRDRYNGALADLHLGLSPWTMNRYGFAGGNPITLIELDGHVPTLPEEDLRELREAGYTWRNGAVAPLASLGATVDLSHSTPAAATSKGRGGFGSTELHNAVRDELLRRLCPWKGSYWEESIMGRCEKELRMPGGSRDHADIAMFGRGEIYEVKPDTEDWIRQGRDQVDRYLQQLNKARVRMPEYRPGTRWLKGKDPGAGITGIRAWEPGRAFRSFHMDYKGHRILVRYAGHGVATYRPECGDDCDDPTHENVEKPTRWYTVTTPFRWLTNLILPGIRGVPAPVPA